MSNDLTKVYQFLSSYNQNGKTWVDSADKNDDGIIIKAEFKEFVNDNYKNWSGNESGETLSADIINNFWKKIDTTVSGKVAGSSKSNRNALDKNEQAALDKKLEAYVALNDFIKENVDIPTVLTTTGTQWKAAVTDALSSILEKNASKGVDALKELWAEQLPAIANKQTALFCATEYQNTLVNGLLKDYPDYKVADDSTLNKLIEAYLTQINGEYDEETIKSDIQEIMKSYLETAGIGEGGSYDLSALGYEMKDGDKLNGIQEAVVKASIKKNLEEIKSDADYEKYKEYYDKAIEEFINAEVGKATAGTFEEAKAIGLEEFKASDAYKNIQLRVVFDTVFENTEIVDTNKLYKALSDQFGTTIAERIVKDGVYMPAYTKITSAALEKVMAGEFLKEDGSFDVDAVVEYVVSEISKNLNSFTEGVFGDMSLGELKELYTKISKNADEMDDKDAALKAKRNAAIDYCTTIAAKSESLKQAVIDVFGENYTNKINSMYPSEIEEAMDKLFTAVDNIGDITAITDDEKKSLLNNVAATHTVGVGEAKSVNLPTSATVDGKTITTDRITYKASGAVSVQDGKLVIDSSKVGTYTGTLTMFIDGVEVTSKTITVTVENKINSAQIVDNVKDWSGTAPDGVTVMRNANGNNVGDAISSSDFSDLYNNDAVICLGFYKDNDKYNWGRDGASVIKEKLTGLGSYVVDTIASANSSIDKTLLTKAMKTVVNKYAVNPDPDKGTYYRENSGDTPANFYNYMKNNKNKIKNGLVQAKDSDGADSNVYGLYFKEFVDAIINEYNKLVK